MTMREKAGIVLPSQRTNRGPATPEQAAQQDASIREHGLSVGQSNSCSRVQCSCDTACWPGNHEQLEARLARAGILSSSFVEEGFVNVHRPGLRHQEQVERS